jgi:hypothetical protein
MEQPAKNTKKSWKSLSSITQNSIIIAIVLAVTLAIAIPLLVVYLKPAKITNTGSDTTSNTTSDTTCHDCDGRECGAGCGAANGCGECSAEKYCNIHGQCSITPVSDNVPYQFRVTPIHVLSSNFSDDSTKYSARISWVGPAVDSATISVNGSPLYLSSPSLFHGSTWRNFVFDRTNPPCDSISADQSVCDANIQKQFPGGTNFLTLRTAVVNLLYGTNTITVIWGGTTSNFNVEVPDNETVLLNFGDPNIGYGAFDGDVLKLANKQDIFTDYIRSLEGTKRAHGVMIGGDVFYSPSNGVPDTIFTQSLGSSQLLATMMLVIPGNHDYQRNGSGESDTGACGLVQFYPLDTHANKLYSGGSEKTTEPAFPVGSPPCTPNSFLTDYVNISVIGRVCVVAFDPLSISLKNFCLLNWKKVHERLKKRHVHSILFLSHWDVDNLPQANNYTTEDARDEMASVEVDDGVRFDHVYGMAFSTNHGHLNWFKPNGFEFSWNGLANGQSSPVGTGFNPILITYPENYTFTAGAPPYQQSWVTQANEKS